MSKSIIPFTGRAALAEAVLARKIHLALGDGGPDWNPTNPPLPDLENRALVNERARKALYRGFYVLPDDHGEIVLSKDYRFTSSADPTRYLYLHFVFEHNEGMGFPVNETGVFLGTVPQPGAEGKTFLLPEEIRDPGILFYLSHPDDPETYNPQKNGEHAIVVAL